MTQNNISKIVKEAVSVLNPRTRNVIEKRYGLRNGEPQTLESIGKEYKITRERVRQIEASGLKYLSEAKERSKSLADFLRETRNYLASFGGIRKETMLLADFAKAAAPVKRKVADCEANFLMALDEDLNYTADTNEFYAAWSLDKEIYSRIKQGLNNLIKNLEVKSEPLAFGRLVEESLNCFGALAKNRGDEILAGWLDLSKLITSNPYGEYGLVSRPEIRPQGVRDKAYLVIKKEKTPLHFFQISRLIEKTFKSARPVNHQTVHNELIKDPRFVLVGRGTYALRDWGFEPGTVKEIIASILKKYRKPLAKNEILEAVSKQRQVKELTVIFNLQNKKFFKRLADGRYALNEELIIEET